MHFTLELSSKLHIKEDEFEQLSHELDAIKMATLGKFLLLRRRVK